MERIVAIAGAFLAATPKVPRTIKVPNNQPAMTERINEERDRSDHCLVVDPASGQALCSLCLSRAPLQPKRLLAWLGSPCDSLAAGCPHHSHRTDIRGMLVICRSCGCWSSSRHRALLSPCNGEPATGLQKMALRKFASDLPMPGRNFSHIRDQVPRRRRQLPQILVVTGLDSDSE